MFPYVVVHGCGFSFVSASLAVTKRRTTQLIARIRSTQASDTTQKVKKQGHDWTFGISSIYRNDNRGNNARDRRNNRRYAGKALSQSSSFSTFMFYPLCLSYRKMEAEAKGASSNCTNRLLSGLPNSASIVARTTSGGSAGASVCRCANSRAISGPIRSGRVLSTWPSLMKVVPSSVNARRTRSSILRSGIFWPSTLRIRSWTQEKFRPLTQSAKPYFASTPMISPTRWALRSRCRRPSISHRSFPFTTV